MVQFFKMRHAGSELSHMHEVSPDVDTQHGHLEFLSFFFAAVCMAP